MTLTTGFNRPNPAEEVGDVQRLGGEWSLFFRDIDGMELEVCCPAVG